PSLITPDTLAKLKAEIYFRITPSGEVYDLQVVTPSGDNNFDSSVIEAVKLTAKLPLPEDRQLKKYVLTEGLQWGFTSSTL
ncbi:MAG TPA: TonB family protein, partial [bacterium]|nr:TonB family protein [bacterium]